MTRYHTQPATDRPHPVLSRKHWGRMGVRLAAGLSKARVAAAEGVAEEVVDALSGDAEFEGLRGEFEGLLALGHEERMRRLRDRAFLVLQQAIEAEDLRAAVFMIREELQGRCPLETLIDRFWRRVLAERPASRAPQAPDRGASRDATADRVEADRGALTRPVRPRPAPWVGGPPSAMPGARTMRRGLEALGFGLQEEMTAFAARPPHLAPDRAVPAAWPAPQPAAFMPPDPSHLAQPAAFMPPDPSHRHAPAADGARAEGSEVPAAPVEPRGYRYPMQEWYWPRPRPRDGMRAYYHRTVSMLPIRMILAVPDMFGPRVPQGP